MTSGGFSGLYFSTTFECASVPESRSFEKVFVCVCVCFWMELPLIMADANGRNDECVVRLQKLVLLKHTCYQVKRVLEIYRWVNLENGVCASFCNFVRVLVQVGVFITVCVAEKLGSNCFTELLLVYFCILCLFLLFMMLSGFSVLK